MGGVTCDLCGKDAYARFAWTTSSGQQSANFCKEHADEGWRRFQNTAAAETLIISDPQVKKNG